ncbi:MAG TPA: DUF1501 domain-containing protein [Phycisphaerae bacterium]|nr:DUF1501 domain-containing protein [Phycisphaerae bacterium]
MSDDLIFTRREMLARGLTLVSAAATIPYFLDRTAVAVAGANDGPRSGRQRGNEAERILVVLQLAGGNDGLNTIVPVGNDRYYEARPQIAIPKNETLKVNDDLAFPKQAEGLKRLYDDGLLAILQGVGYPNPNRSHFVATDIWSTADPTEATHNGWIGRYFDCACKGSDRPNPRRGIALTQEAPLAMQGARFSPVSFGSPDELTFRGPAAGGKGTETFNKLNRAKKRPGLRGDEPFAPKNEVSALAYLERMAMDARASADEIQSATGSTGANQRGGFQFRFKRPGRGGELGAQLEMVHRMIAAGLETKVYYVSMGGFDTHAGQIGRHPNLIQQLGEALHEFVDNLRDAGLLDRVTIMTFSEFGRRVAENGSNGTDHGAAAPLFVIGNHIRPGVHGEHPSLEPNELDAGDLQWHTDFRSIYAAVLEDWLKTNPERILGGPYEKVSLFV